MYIARVYRNLCAYEMTCWHDLCSCLPLYIIRRTWNKRAHTYITQQNFRPTFLQFAVSRMFANVRTRPRSELFNHFAMPRHRHFVRYIRSTLYSCTAFVATVIIHLQLPHSPGLPSRLAWWSSWCSSPSRTTQRQCPPAPRKTTCTLPSCSPVTQTGR